MAAPYGPDVVGLLETDVTYGVLGDHGGHQELVQSIPMIFSGPGIGSTDSRSGFDSWTCSQRCSTRWASPTTSSLDGEAVRIFRIALVVTGTEGRPELIPIGVVESSLIDPAAAPKQGHEGAPEAWIVIRSGGARRPPAEIEVGDRVIVLTWLHRARRDIASSASARRSPPARFAASLRHAPKPAEPDRAPRGRGAGVRQPRACGCATSGASTGTPCST